MRGESGGCPPPGPGSVEGAHGGAPEWCKNENVLKHTRNERKSKKRYVFVVND